MAYKNCIGGEKRMKRKILFSAVMMACIIVLSVTGMPASAHPPSFVNLKHEDDTLQVLVIHFSLVPFAFGIHHVYKIEIEKNGQTYDSQNFDEQPRFIFNMYEFEVLAEQGDEIKVTAFCSLFGQKTKTIAVG